MKTGLHRNLSTSRAARLFGLIGTLALLTAACGSSSSASAQSSANPSTPVTLRLGLLTNLTHAAALVGLQQGFFNRDLPANVTLQTSSYNAGPAEVTALLAGSLDAAYMGPNSAITAYTEGRKSIRIIAGATSGGAALVVAPSITSAAQLKGKTVATPQLGNTQDVALRTWLTTKGVSFPGPDGGSGDVTILPEDNSTTLLSFEAGTIAGAWVPQPWAARMVAEGHGHVLVNERSLWPNGQFSTTVLVVTTSFLHAHPTVVSALLKGDLATTAFLNASPVRAQAGANTELSTLTGRSLKPVELTAAWSDLTFTIDPIASSITADLAHAKAAGFSTTNINGIFDLGPINELLKAQGQKAVTSS